MLFVAQSYLTSVDSGKKLFRLVETKHVKSCGLIAPSVVIMFETGVLERTLPKKTVFNINVIVVVFLLFIDAGKLIFCIVSLYDVKIRNFKRVIKLTSFYPIVYFYKI